MFCSVPSQRGISLSFLYSIVKEITETASSALFLDIYLKFDTNGKRSTRLNDKRHGFHFAIVNVLHLDMEFMLHNSYVTLELAFNIHTFFIVTEFWKLILLNQGFSKNLLILPFQKKIGRCQHIIEKYHVSCVQMAKDVSDCCLAQTQALAVILQRRSLNWQIFEVMTSTLSRGTLGSVASLLAASLYLRNPDRTDKLWNILTERYILLIILPSGYIYLLAP